jgi:hypothetical protein
MRRWIGWGFFGLAAFAASLLATLPAERALEWGAGVARGNGVLVAANGVSGTAWRGNAANATVNGIELGRATWSLSPWWLALGRLDLHWRMEPQQGWIEGDARVSASGFRLQNAQGKLPAPLLVSHFARTPSFVAVDGTVSLQVDELASGDGKIESVKATLVWSQAALVQPAAVRLGDLKVELTPGAHGAITGKLSDGGGPLALSGSVTINPDTTYRLNATLSARPGADATLVNSLPMLGRADGKGGYQLVWAGRVAR